MAESVPEADFILSAQAKVPLASLDAVLDTVSMTLKCRTNTQDHSSLALQVFHRWCTVNTIRIAVVAQKKPSNQIDNCNVVVVKNSVDYSQSVLYNGLHVISAS